MAHFEELPVYKACYELLLTIYKDLNKLPRDIRYTMLETMKNELVQIAGLICRANATRDKLQFIQQAKDLMLSVKLKIRLLYDLHYINLKTFSRLAELGESVSKQLTSWYDYQNKSAHSQNPV